jgi:hypothetical protein
MADTDERAVSPLRAEELLAELARHGVEFVIIGGFALAAHGVVRGTEGVDIVPDPVPDNLARLARALQALRAQVMLADDFDPSELGIEPDAKGLAMGGNWVLRTRLGRLAVMQFVAGIKSYDSLRDGSVAHEVAGAGVFRFAGLDDLIAMKTAAARPQDQIDVASLERARRPRDE